eukprot:15330209-Ditylum_brightwellii.AAC.1
MSSEDNDVYDKYTVMLDAPPVSDDVDGNWDTEMVNNDEEEWCTRVDCDFWNIYWYMFTNFGATWAAPHA